MLKTLLFIMFRPDAHCSRLDFDDYGRWILAPQMPVSMGFAAAGSGLFG